MLLIGSRAFFLRQPFLLKRNPNDFDFVCSQNEFESWMKDNSWKVNPSKVYQEDNKMIVEGSSNCEFEIAHPNSSAELLLQLAKNDPETQSISLGNLPSLDLLFTIKDSHKYKKFKDNVGGFYKTATDWFLMKNVGAKIRPEYKEFHLLREKETYVHKLPSLNMNKENFFNEEQNGVHQIVEHDDIHKATAIYDQPAYQYYLEDNQEVKTSKKKFFEVSEEIRMAGVLEESFTLAIERSLLPYPGTWTSDFAFKFALAKVCTSITSGFFRQFAFENLFKIIDLYNKNHKNYFDKFNYALKNGQVRFLKH